MLNKGLLPKYTYFKINNPVVHDDTDTRKYCSLVKRQINYNKEKNEHPQKTWKDPKKFIER